MNEHITENLQYYLSLKDPQYAILLSGKWGCGKTFFIDKFAINENNQNGKDNKFIKISLFGLQNIPEVNNKIILQLLNIDKQWFRRIAKVIQPYTKILNLPIQDLSIDKIFNKKFIFIFDDLERSNIKLSEILGYINYFVEQSNFKVIILADDTKIEDKEFIQFKEKVIGKTFEIHQDFDAVLTVFLGLSTQTREVLTTNKQSIKDVYDKAGYNNLRHIRQTILDFEYFYQYIDDQFKNNNDFLKELISLFFAFSIEVKKANLKVDKINQYNHSFVFNEAKTDFDKILDKYSLSNGWSLVGNSSTVSFLIGKENWENILFKGYLKKDDINESISYNSYFAEDKQETWGKLWHFRDLEDKEFETILANVIDNFKHNKYKEHQKILHVVSILLFLSKEGFCNTTQAEILIQAKSNIDAKVKTPYWQENIYKHDPLGGGAYSLAYMDRESDIFKEIVEYLMQKSQEAFNMGLIDKGNRLLEYFKDNDIEALKAKLVLEELGGIAIFSKIDVDDFINTLLDVKHSNLRRIFGVLEQRYPNHTKLTQDLAFWQGVDRNLLNKINKITQPVKYFLMTGFKKYTLKKIIDTLKE